MEQKSKFDKVMGAWDILVIAFGAMIGWGWVINSGDWITTAGFAGSMIAMLIGGLMVFFVGLTYAELTSAMPQCGGEHVFSYRAMGPTGSFVCTWMIILGYVATSAFEATALPTVITYLFPDFKKLTEGSGGLWEAVYAAMGQSFFTLSLGIGAMAIFGSYIGKERSLLGESANIAILDTFVAIVSGLIIFPACFTFGVSPTSGPSLIFITLPNIFNHIPMGRLWGSLFFIFMTFAAFSTVLAVFENIISCMMELTGWSRKKSSLVNLFGIILLSLPCVLGYNVWSWDGFSIFGGAVLELEDFLVSNILLPLGSLVYLLFCTSRYGWGWKNFKAEANTGKGFKMQEWMRVYLSYILPLMILFIFGYGIYDKFFA